MYHSASLRCLCQYRLRNILVGVGECLFYKRSSDTFQLLLANEVLMGLLYEGDLRLIQLDVLCHSPNSFLLADKACIN